jgi:phosphate transport system permease protein
MGRIINKETIMKILFSLAALASIVAVLLICVFLFANGVPAIREIGVWEFLSGTIWKPNDANPSYGILPMIIGSIYVTAGALLVGVPIGLLTAIFMARFCPKKIYKPLKIAIDLLAGIPSVVYGFFGLMVLVPFIRSNFSGNGVSIFTASILLGIMILPTIISVSEAAIRAVENTYYEGSLALGATHEEKCVSGNSTCSEIRNYGWSCSWNWKSDRRNDGSSYGCRKSASYSGQYF